MDTLKFELSYTTVLLPFILLQLFFISSNFKPHWNRSNNSSEKSKYVEKFH